MRLILNQVVIYSQRSEYTWLYNVIKCKTSFLFKSIFRICRICLLPIENANRNTITFIPSLWRNERTDILPNTETSKIYLPEIYLMVLVIRPKPNTIISRSIIINEIFLNFVILFLQRINLSTYKWKDSNFFNWLKPRVRDHTFFAHQYSYYFW